jgi:hypothetical protein
MVCIAAAVERLGCCWVLRAAMHDKVNLQGDRAAA